MTKKVTLILILVMAIVTIACPKTVNANLQSRPNATSLTSKTASDFFLLSRQMETSTGPMGLNASIEVQSDKVVETSAPNNIDVHMIKNTEYGTAAILSASAYGSCPKGYGSSIVDSSTGNASGIKQMAKDKYEYVAGIYNKSTTNIKYIYNADAWHKNVYESNDAATAYIPGDATYETQYWRGASSANFVSSGSPVFLRSSGGVFNCNYSGGYRSGDYGSRVAVVCGAGL